MVNIEIDGKQVEVEKGSTVIEAAQKAGIYIPHFCYHKKLSVAANCRMCLVEVEKTPKPLPACATPVGDGMKVHTHSELAVKAQRGVMEFLLINHPLDCPICDQGGECDLQDLAMGYGGNASRYTEEKRIVQHKEVGELISTKEMSRCIHCTRCVRFGEEIAGIRELGMANRNEHAEILSFVNSSIDSELSGNMIDLCPVGALTSKPFRYTARNWELSRRRSVSPHDGLGSNLAVLVKGGKVMRVDPVEDETLNECWITDKDRFSYQGLNSDQRLTRPMIRQNGQWQEAEWSVALEYVANGLRQVMENSDVDQVGALASPHSTLEELFLLQRIMRGLGSNNIDSRLRQLDCSADGQQQGAPWLGMPVAEVSQCDRYLIIGSFLRKDQPLLAQRIRLQAKQGAHVNLLHCADDDLLMPIKHKLLVAPDQMVDRLAAVVKSLSEQLNVELEQDVSQFVADAQTSELTHQIAQSLMSGSRQAVFMGNLAQQHPQYSVINKLAQVLADMLECPLGVLGEAANSTGAHLAGAVPYGFGAPGMSAAEMLENPRKAYVLMNVEPELDCNNSGAALQAMQQADLVVCLSPFKHQGMEYADVMLPISPFTETSGTFVNTEGRVQSFKGAVKPLGDTRPGWKVLRVLANMLNISGVRYESSAQVCEEVIAGRNLNRLLNNHIDVDLTAIESSSSDASLQRVADVPIYFADSIVRRADALQKTNNAAAPVLGLNREDMTRLGLEAGDLVEVTQGGQSVSLPVYSQKNVIAGTARISAAHALTSVLGPMSGAVQIKKLQSGNAKSESTVVEQA